MFSNLTRLNPDVQQAMTRTVARFNIGHDNKHWLTRSPGGLHPTYFLLRKDVNDAREALSICRLLSDGLTDIGDMVRYLLVTIVALIDPILQSLPHRIVPMEDSL